MTFAVGDKVLVNTHALIPSERGLIGDVSALLSHGNFQVDFGGGDRRGFSPESLIRLPRAIDRLTPGMSSTGLADAVEETIRQVRDRVTGVGDEQYSTDKGQKFEGTKVSTLIRMAREEAQDLVVYAVMTDIRLARIESAIEGVNL